ncbi:MAG: hypothetical protein ACOYO1_18770 [Bacteroidales bacterium]
MLSDFFRINLPYGIVKCNDNKWMAINYENLPIGFNSEELKSQPGKGHFDYPIYTKYKDVTEEFLIDLSFDEYTIHRNEAGEIDEVFLYKANSIPLNPEEMDLFLDNYFEKLKKLSKLKKAIF